MVKIPAQQNTIAFLTNALDDPNCGELWRGIVDITRERGGRVITFAGGSSGDPSGEELPRAVIYDLVNPARLDGIILWGAMINTFVTSEEIRAMAFRHLPLPVVSIGLELEGIPSVVVDNYAGMWAAISHLVSVHHRQRIVFVGGPEGHAETDLRFRAYQDVLAHFGIPLRQELVFSADFAPAEAKTIVARLLDERQLHFDAIAVTDDRVAAAVTDELIQRGVKVPEQVSVVGFDDQDLARCQSTPLTTVRIPNYEVGRQAAMLLLDCQKGEPASQVIKVPLQLVVRQSCGCPLAAVQNARLYPPDQAASGLEELPAGQISPILEAFLTCLDLDEPAGSAVFLERVGQIIRQRGSTGADLFPLEELVSTVRREVLPSLAGQTERAVRAENACHQARVMIAEAVQRHEVQRRIQSADTWTLLNDIGQLLVATYDREKLAELTYRRLPEIGIQGCYLSIYEDPAHPAEWARLVVAYDQDQFFELPQEGVRFHAQDWIPRGFSLGEGSAGWMFLPVNFNQEQIGFVLFRAGADDLIVYETLRSQLGSALKGAALLNEVVALSLTDSLTGLSNRRAFDLFLNNEVEHSRRFFQDLAMILIDLDHFKEYNDSFGHPAGDDALMIIGRDLAKAARRGLDIAARLGGDEFALLLVGTNMADAILIANEICQRAPGLPGLLRPITLSLGVAVAEGRKRVEPGQLVDLADRRLYQAKQSGRNRVARI